VGYRTRRTYGYLCAVTLLAWSASPASAGAPAAVIRHHRRNRMADIVLATRFGPSSAEPARVAAELARQLGSRIVVLYVASELQALNVGAAEAGLDPAAERERIDRRINVELREFVETYMKDIGFDVRIVEGDVAEQVAEVARDVGAAYVVVGTRGRSQLARLILGDTTQSILQRTPCPVIVVPLHESGEPH
jgi:nucleotide-binding universal stress UspA family protein